MNALQMARTAYASTAAPIRTERGTEYEAFARITGDMVRTARTRTADFPAFVDALSRNRRLWTVIAANVADTQNALDPDLRARLFYLADFTLAHTRDVLAGREDASVLIEVNTAVMQGLRSGDSVAKPAETAQPLP